MTHTEALAALPAITLDVTLGALELVELPPFVGYTLRGALWGALKSTGCQSSNSGLSCQNACAWPDRCLYGLLAETPHSETSPKRIQSSKYAPHPVLITPPVRGGILYPGDTLKFAITLFGDARRLIEGLIASLARMAQLGIGKGRGKMALRSVRDACSHDLLWHDAEPDTLDLSVLSPERLVLPSLPLSPEAPRARLSLVLPTPLGLMVRGNLLKNFDFSELLYATLDRFLLLAACHGECADYEAVRRMPGEVVSRVRELPIEVVRENVACLSVERYSARQRRHHDIEGLVGQVVLEGPLAQLAPVLELARVIHVGQHTTFGMGCLSYTLSDVG